MWRKVLSITKEFGHLLSWKICWITVCVLTISFLTVSLLYLRSKPSTTIREANETKETIHVVATACGKKFEDVLVMAKSLALTTSTPVVLHVFLDKHMQLPFRKAISAWPNHMRRNFECIVRDIFLPARAIGGIPPDFWARFFSQCAYITLFVPEALPELDSVIYVDADTLFLSPVEDLWAQTAKFDTEQYLGMTLENNPGGRNFYHNFKAHPIYGKMGLNTGLVLYDLRKMNRTQFLIDIKKLFIEYETKFQLLDQGLLNIYAHFLPERVFEISCTWNFRSEYCSNDTCPDALKSGIQLLHGNRNGFHSGTVPAFKAAYGAFQAVPHKISMLKEILAKLKEEISKPGITARECGAYPDMYTLQLQRIVKDYRGSH